MDDSMFLNLVKNTVERHGCRLVDVDFDDRVVNLDGPDEAMENCAIALAALLD
jgi:hypothetical protein